LNSNILEMLKSVLKACNISFNERFKDWLKYPLCITALGSTDNRISRQIAEELYDSKFDFSKLYSLKGAAKRDGTWSNTLSASSFFKRDNIRKELKSIIDKNAVIESTTELKLFLEIHFGSLNITNILKAFKTTHPAAKLLLCSDHLHEKFSTTRPSLTEVRYLLILENRVYNHQNYIHLRKLYLIQHFQ